MVYIIKAVATAEGVSAEGVSPMWCRARGERVWYFVMQSMVKSTLYERGAKPLTLVAIAEGVSPMWCRARGERVWYFVMRSMVKSTLYERGAKPLTLVATAEGVKTKPPRLEK